MIKIKSSKGKGSFIIKGERFETANEAVNIAVHLVEHFEAIDKALGAAVRKTIIDALEGRAQPKGEQGEETEAEE